MSTTSNRRQETGFLSIQYVLAVGMSLLFLVVLTNYVLVQYGRGVVRAAADEGARAGARVVSDPVATCRARQEDVLSGMGKMASNVTSTCEVAGNEIRATVKATFAGWVPGVPDFDETATAVSLKEGPPA